MKKGKRKTDNKTNALSENDKQRLDKLQTKFLAAEDFKSKDADSFSLFIANNDPKLSRRLSKLDEADKKETKARTGKDTKNEQKGLQFNSPFFDSSVTLYYNNPDVGQGMLEYINGFTKTHSEYIDKSFEEYFNKLLTVNSNQDLKNELKKHKDYLKTYFAHSIVVRVWTDKVFSDFEKFGGKEFIQQQLSNYVAEMFFFAGITFNALDGDIEALKEKISESKKLKPDDPSHKRYFGFINEMLANGLTKYKVVQNYFKNEGKNMNTTEKSVSNAFDSFLKNHKKEIIDKLQLTEKEFTNKFFPSTLSQK